MLVKDSPNMVSKRTILILTNPYTQCNNTNITMLEKGSSNMVRKETNQIHKKVTILERGPSNMVT